MLEMWTCIQNLSRSCIDERGFRCLVLSIRRAIEEYLKSHDYYAISDIDDICLIISRMAKELKLGTPKILAVEILGDTEIIEFENYLIQIDAKKQKVVKIEKI